MRLSTPHTLAALLCLAACGACSCGGGVAQPPSRAERPALLFADVSAAAGLDTVQLGGDPGVDHIIESLGAGGAWLDHDLDGDADLYLAQGAVPSAPYDGPPDVLWRNEGDLDGDGVPRFRDVTREAGLGDTLWSVGVAVADYDGDGDPDIYLTNWGPNRLYRNNGDGTFTDVARAAGVDDPAWGTSAAWSDTDLDGDLDLYVANYIVFEFGRYPSRGATDAARDPACRWRGVEVFCGPRGLEAAPDRFFRNDGDPDGDGIPSFVEVAAEVGLQVEEARYGLAVSFVDLDDDGDDDLYVANDGQANTYFANAGGRFEESATLAGLAYDEQGHEQAGMGVATGDYNGDGRVDLLVTNFSHDHDTLYRNDGDMLFTDDSFPAGLGTPSWLKLGWGVRFVDLDQDGREDVVSAYGHVFPQVDERKTGTRFRQRNGLYQNLGDGTFADVAESAGAGLALAKSSRALLPVDIDLDGDLDLLVTNFNDTPDLLRNDGAPGNWLQVRLVGKRGNRDALGARVTLTAGGTTQFREVRRGTGYAGSTLPVAHFGLGRAGRVERIEVRWPAGRTSELRDVAVNQLLMLREE
ncbi:MAG: CRTAC1 family protein [bacterium]|nr:CRTAC1 family protein [bacterium]